MPVWWWLACARPGCEPGEIRDADGACAPYVPEDPVPHDDVWRPPPGTSWQIQYSGRLDPSPDVAMFDLDLFDAPDAVLDALAAEGRAVVCYFSAGSYEDWRPDADRFPEEALGRPLDGWPGEWWVDVAHPTVRAILEDRMDLAVARGCTGVDPDNVNGWANPTGLPITRTDQLAFDRFLADAAHERGLSIGLKNDLEQIPELVDWFDWAVNEECADYDECGRLAPFTDAGLAVFHVEYVERWSDAAAKAGRVCGAGRGLSTLIKTWALGPEFLPCP